MAVDIEVFGQLLPGKPRRQAMKIQKPETARELAMTIGLNPDDIGLITINGMQSSLDDLVQSDSRLCFFPYITGG
ncbi:MAG: MoaD/ThiS family protein [Acidobacteria bacterium]|nr:MoaD/ThiS family protein [Acidobacteriota bacterium]